MRRVLMLACAIFLALAATAAARARAEGVDTFTAVKGSWFKNENWSLKAKPTFLNEVVIPPGDAAIVNKAGAESNSLTMEGRVSGTFEVMVHNSLWVKPGGDPDVKIGMDGLGTIRSEGEAPYWMYLKGIHVLESPLTVETTFWLEHGGTFHTHGYDVHVPIETYMADGSTLYMENSTWTTGSYYVYPPPGLGGAQGDKIEAEHSNLIVNRPSSYAEPGLNNSIMSCVSQQFGHLTLEGYGERTRGECKAAWLTLNQNFGGIGIEAGSMVEPGALTSNGTGESPAFVKSTTEGMPYTIRVPHDEMVEGCIAFSDAHVVGGSIVDPCEGDRGGNTGIIFG